MDGTPLLADSEVLTLERIEPLDELVVLVVAAKRPAAACPPCKQMSSQVHSHHERTLADLPWQGVTVQLKVATRRFVCAQSLCLRQIFCERLSGVALAYGRKTERLQKALHHVGFATSGEAGARLSEQIGMCVGPDATEAAAASAVSHPSHPSCSWDRRLGVTKRTLLRDLTRGLGASQTYRLLPEHEAAPLAAWLKAHPGGEIISRDRLLPCIEGAREGAPQAVQVADRWHLLKNLTETVQRFVTRQHELIRQVTANIRDVQLLDHVLSPSLSRFSSREPKLIEQNRAKRYARYCQVVQLHQQGWSKADIARKLGIHAVTVRTYINAGTFPERAQYRLGSKLDPYLPYLNKRWLEGCKNPDVLWREVAGQGYPGKPKMVRRYIAWLGRCLKDFTPEQQRQFLGAATTFKTPSTRRVTSWLLKKPGTLKADQQAFILRLSTENPDVAEVQELARAFQQMIRERQPDVLPAWLEQAEQSSVTEMKSFATGIKQDYAAVAAALEHEWSNGQTEGQITRLKLIKRQMYGRANFDLLKARVLYAG